MTETVKSVKKRLAKRQVEIDGTTYFVAEGDQLVPVKGIAQYVKQLNARAEQAKADSAAANAGFVNLNPMAALIVVTDGGTGANAKIVRWRDGVVLTYCVLKNTFGSNAEYLKVRQAMKKATSAWSDVCGIQFEHKVDLDTSPTTTPKGVVFTVRKVDMQGKLIAAAFFPDDPKDRRMVVIDPSFFSAGLSFDPIGVLRHELGHVLGFRHEHIRSGAPASCPDEDLAKTLDLTKYDPQSVMHYFCGGVGSSELLISAIDREGAQKVYGLPFSAYSFVD